MFDAIDAHPWVGAQIAREPWRSAALQIFESVGGQLQALGVPERARFNAGSALVTYILGAAGQNAANARLLPRDTDRSAFLATLVAQWAQLDPQNTRSCDRRRRSYATTMTASNSLPALTSSWPASEPVR